MTNKTWLKQAALTSVLVLLPIAVGIVFWDSLPQTVATHWGADGMPDGFSSKAFAVFVPTGFLFLVHWLCTLMELYFGGIGKQSKKVIGIVLWILPVLSFVVNAQMYLTAFGKDFDMLTVLPHFLGLLFMVLGNYLPKIRQNRTFGIKLPWTLQSEENWNKTHRMAGKLWVIGGALQMLTALLPRLRMEAFLGILFVLILVPSVYSYLLWRKEK